MSRASNRPASTRRPASTGLAIFIASFAVLAAAGWILLVAGLHAHEMEVGAGALILTLLFLLVVRHEDCDPLDLRLKDIAQGWRIPWYLLSGMSKITVIFVKDLISRSKPGSFYRVCPFEIDQRNRRLVARGVLATVFTTASPNFIVIGIDADQRLLLFYQIERSSVPKMTQSLGARP